MDHPISEASLRRFAAGVASREEGKKILAHLLRGCSACSQTLQGVMGPRESVPPAAPRRQSPLLAVTARGGPGHRTGH